MKKQLFTLLLGVLSLGVFAQNTSILWARHSDNHTTFSDIQPTTDGGFIAVGGINPLGASSPSAVAVAGENAWMVKTDDTGGVVWQKSYGGSDFERFIEVKQTPDGGYLAVGYTKSTDGDVVGNHGGSDIWIVKTNDTGAIQWSKCYGGTNHEQMNTILFGAGAPYMTNMVAPTSDGGYVIVATTSSNDGQVSGYHGASHVAAENRGDIWMIKIDSTGTLLWQKCIGGSMNEWASTILKTADGGFIIGAVTSSSDGDALGSNQHGGRHSVSEGGDYWVVKTDSVGTVQWQKCYGGSSFELTSGLIASQEGGYLIAGASYSTDGDVSAQIAGIGNNTKPWLVKINDRGLVEWDKSYWVDSSTNSFNIPNWENVYGVSQGIDGNYNLIVSSAGFVGIVKVNTTGDVVSYFNHYADLNKPTRLYQLMDGSFMSPGGYKNPFSTRGTGVNIPQALIIKYAACPAYTYDTVTICKGASYTFGSQTVSTAGIYWDTLNMASGCDSLIKLTLLVDSIVTPIITATGNMLSTGTYTSYQWLDGHNSPIGGATAQTYNATTAGSYRIVVTGANGCSDTSLVYNHNPISINEPAFFSTMKLYPNPASDVVYIEMPELKDKATATINTLDGRTLVTKSLLPGTKQSLSMEALPGGVYFIKISTKEGIAVRKIVKE